MVPFIHGLAARRIDLMSIPWGAGAAGLPGGDHAAEPTGDQGISMFTWEQRTEEHISWEVTGDRYGLY